MLIIMIITLWRDRVIKVTFKKYIILSCIYSILFSFIFFAVDYSDGRETFFSGYLLAKSLFSGKDVLNSLIEYEYTYGFFYYVIVAIWSCPVVIMDLFCNPPINMYNSQLLCKAEYTADLSELHILWYKTFLLLTAIICIIYLYKIIYCVLEFFEGGGKKDTTSDNLFNFKPLSRETLKWIFFFITSPCFVFFPFSITQCDIVMVTFLLISVYYLLFKKNEVAFSIFMAFSIAIKYYFVFFYLPLLIIIYWGKLKKLFKILAPSIILIATTILIHYFHYYYNCNSFEVNSASDLAITRAKGLATSLPFILLYMLFLIFVLVIKNQYKPNPAYLLFYLGFVSMGILFVFYYAQLYWLIVLEVLMVLCCVYLRNKDKLLYLEIAFIYLFMLFCSTENDFFVFGNKPFHGLLLKQYELLHCISGINNIWHMITYRIDQSIIVTSLHIVVIILFLVCILYFSDFKSSIQRSKQALKSTNDITLFIASTIHVATIIFCLVMEIVGKYFYYK